MWGVVPCMNQDWGVMPISLCIRFVRICSILRSETAIEHSQSAARTTVRTKNTGLCHERENDHILNENTFYANVYKCVHPNVDDTNMDAANTLEKKQLFVLKLLFDFCFKT